MLMAVDATDADRTNLKKCLRYGNIHRPLLTPFLPPFDRKCAAGRLRTHSGCVLPSRGSCYTPHFLLIVVCVLRHAHPESRFGTAPPPDDWTCCLWPFSHRVCVERRPCGRSATGFVGKEDLVAVQPLGLWGKKTLWPFSHRVCG